MYVFIIKFIFIYIVLILFAASWRSVKNRRQFFENYAVKNGFDFLNADAWYSQSRTNILSTEVFERNNTNYKYN